MVNKLIAEVSAGIWAVGRPSNSHPWDADFNVASWVKASGKGELSLLLCHEDEAGKHGRIVDQCSINGIGTCLMCGLTSVRFTGKVIKVQVLLKLSDPEIRFQVEELFVQRNRHAMRRETKLISSG